MATRLTMKQVVSISNLLDKHLTTEGEGMCRYVNGGSDAKVAKEAGVHVLTIARLRRELKGRLPSAIKAKDKHDPALELAAVTSKLALATAELAEKLGDLDLGKICRGLAQDATECG